MAFRSLDKLINLADGYRRAYRIDHRELLLVQEGGERFLFERCCPHAGQRLDEAEIVNASVRCPRHGYCFSLRSGAALGNECRPLTVYTLVYEGNSVGLDDETR